jgi:AcrR family transcriptional regulator
VDEAPRREALVDAALAYVLRRGVADLSLRPLAAAIGTSDRMVLYHFGSKRSLVERVLERASSDLAAMVLAELAPAGTSAERLGRLWDRLASAAAEPYLRLWFEVQGLAAMGREPYASVVPGLLAAWHDLSAAVLTDVGVPPAEARRVATVEVAAMQGLLLDLLATGDRDRADRAALDVIAHVVAWPAEGDATRGLHDRLSDRPPSRP